MHRTRTTPDWRLTPVRRVPGWALVASALAAAAAFLATPAIAGPKGMIIVRPLGTVKITIDGSLSDWPLDKFTMVAQQPVFPMAQNMASTTAMGDHLVFDVKRVGLFNGTMPGAFQNGPNDFGASMYFAYDSKFLYILGVFIDNVLRDDNDTSQYGSQGYLNDGFEFFLDPKGDSKGCITNGGANISTDAPYSDDFQVTVALNKNFLPTGAAANVLGARQALAREGNPALIGPGAGQAGGIYQDALTAIGGPDIAAQKYDDLRAAGAKNPEILANPNTKYSGYVIEMRVPFSPKIAGFSPDHNMGFDLFWRDVDMDNDPNAGALNVKWADWGQSTTVTCNGGTTDELTTGLFNADNWGALVFDKADALGQ
jgi:hypothetical protein